MGPNSIPMEIFHLIKLCIAQPLVDIINLSFEKEVTLKNWKLQK